MSGRRATRAALSPQAILFLGLRRVSRRLLLVLAVWILAAWVVERGFRHHLPAWAQIPVAALDGAALIALVLGAALRFLPPTRALRRCAGGLEAVLALAAGVQWLAGGDHRLPILVGHLVHLSSSTGARVLRERLVERIEAGAARLAPLSFAVAIATGTVILWLPVSTRQGTTSFIDALFTATSATCVTGLIVQDTPTHFSSFGHWIILALMQMGGLGTMTLSLSLISAFARPSAREREAIVQVMSVSRRDDVFRMARFVAVVTVTCEGIGWLLLAAFSGPRSEGSSRLFTALFHSVSAFCNAGFSLWSDSLVRAPIPVILTVSALVIGGGLGFVILRDLTDALQPRRSRGLPRRAEGDAERPRARPQRRGWKGLSLHARLGLATTGLLLLAGTGLVFFGEYDNTMRELSFGEKLVHAFFQSATTRTAGFNTLPLERFSPALLFGICMLMTIGACPGGTGGGIKTTTAATLALSLRSLLSPRNRLEAFGRTLPDTLFQRAVAITIAYLGVLFVGIFLLLVVEARPILDLLFEATSALGTVGLSTGITPDLGDVAKLILIGLMFAGRVGPLALALSIGEPGRTGRYRYPPGDVLVG